MTPFWAKLIWFLGAAGWFVIRYPHDRRSRRTPIVQRSDRHREIALLAISFCGLGLVPAVYAVTGEPRIADYAFQPALAWLGLACFAASLWLFYRSHKDLGRYWSVTLEIRDRHRLITTGVYRRVRHPMYGAFWLWAVAQALLLPNWVAGPAGLLGFGMLFFLRIGREERLLEQAFGDEYRDYASRTDRVLPGIF
jgi:protein-S-isoprenylcysteine O-methyltransferase Ste14